MANDRSRREAGHYTNNKPRTKSSAHLVSAFPVLCDRGGLNRRTVIPGSAPEASALGGSTQVTQARRAAPRVTAWPYAAEVGV